MADLYFIAANATTVKAMANKPLRLYVAAEDLSDPSGEVTWEIVSGRGGKFVKDKTGFSTEPEAGTRHIATNELTLTRGAIVQIIATYNDGGRVLHTERLVVTTAIIADVDSIPIVTEIEAEVYASVPVVAKLKNNTGGVDGVLVYWRIAPFAQTTHLELNGSPLDRTEYFGNTVVGVSNSTGFAAFLLSANQPAVVKLTQSLSVGGDVSQAAVTFASDAWNSDDDPLPTPYINDMEPNHDVPITEYDQFLNVVIYGTPELDGRYNGGTVFITIQGNRIGYIGQYSGRQQTVQIPPAILDILKPGEVGENPKNTLRLYYVNEFGYDPSASVRTDFRIEGYFRNRPPITHVPIWTPPLIVDAHGTPSGPITRDLLDDGYLHVLIEELHTDADKVIFNLYLNGYEDYSTKPHGHFYQKDAGAHKKGDRIADTFDANPVRGYTRSGELGRDDSYLEYEVHNGADVTYSYAPARPTDT